MSEKTFRFIVLTGLPGSGKTTLVKKVCALLKENNYESIGFYTEEIRLNKERIGFDVVSLNGERTPLARINRDNGIKKFTVGKYAVDVKSFESLALPLLKCVNDYTILVLDEIGKMELLSNQFKELVNNYIDRSKGILLATVPLKTASTISVIEKIKTHPETIIIHVGKVNRNELHNRIMHCITSSKKKQ